MVDTQIHTTPKSERREIMPPNQRRPHELEKPNGQRHAPPLTLEILLAETEEPEEAKRLLHIHSGRDAETDANRWENGFLVPLRYRPDDIDEGNFLEVMECIKAVAHEIAAAPTVDRELLAALLALLYYPRMWAFHPMQLEGYARDRTHKLDGDALSRLADQLDRIAEAVLYALEGMPDSVGDALNLYGGKLPNYFEAIRKHAEPDE
jgi:hypothetical protein